MRVDSASDAELAASLRSLARAPSGWHERLNVVSRDLVRARIDYPRMTARKAPILCRLDGQAWT